MVGAPSFLVRLLFLILYLKRVQRLFELILGGEAGVPQIGPVHGPFLQAAIIEQTQLVGDDKGHNLARLKTKNPASGRQMVAKWHFERNYSKKKAPIS